jgi:septum formation protein
MLHIPFRVIVPDVDEHVLPGEAPGHYVTRLSRAKAEAVVARAPGAVILAADTTVVLDGAIFEKPTSPANAVEMLSRLQGQTHEVMTAVAVARDRDVAQALDVSRVTFRPADRATLEAYVATGEPMDKAGAYAIQGLGAPLIERVEGDFFGVMGLPLRLALDLLARFGRPYRFTR